MNIAYIVPALVNRGPILVVKDLVGQMVKNGQQCTVFYLDEKEKEIDVECPVQRITFRTRIDWKKYDVVHSHGIRPDLYVFLNKPWRKCRTRFLTTLHNYVFEDFASQYNRVVATVGGLCWILFLQRHDKVVTLSKNALIYYKKWIGLSRLTYAYNMRNLEKACPLTPDERQQIVTFKQGYFLIGMNALLTYCKGVDQLIRALPDLPNYKLFIVGDGKVRDELVHLVKQYKVEEKVLFAGYRKDAYRYLTYYDVYAMPSRSEGFGLSLLEAAIYSVPAVCSDIPVFREIFSSEEVVYFELENIESLVQAIRLAIKNRGIVQRMHQKYLDCYTPESFYQRYYSIYKFVL